MQIGGTLFKGRKASGQKSVAPQKMLLVSQLPQRGRDAALTDFSSPLGYKKSNATVDERKKRLVSFIDSHGITE